MLGYAKRLEGCLFMALLASMTLNWIGVLAAPTIVGGLSIYARSLFWVAFFTRRGLPNQVLWVLSGGSAVAAVAYGASRIYYLRVIGCVLGSWVWSPAGTDE